MAALLRASCALVMAAMIMMNVLMEAHAQLTLSFYSGSCSSVASTVRNTVAAAVKKEPRMAASLLRLHFHDCFVNGCDASVLLDDTTTFTGEKSAFPNRNSLRGFEVIDATKAALEKTCPGVVSCADILAIAAREAVVLAGGPSWSVMLGRRDSVTASAAAANSALPAPTEPLASIIAKFKAVGLNERDVAALSGGHTIGRGRCTNVVPRLYNFSGTGQADPTLQATYASALQAACPAPPGGDANALVNLDPASPDRFDNNYYANLVAGKGLFSSDQQLLSTPGAPTAPFVRSFATSPSLFSTTFGSSMQKMSNILPLTSPNGQIRANCRLVNPTS